MKIPEVIRNQAKNLIEGFGNDIEYIGKYQGWDAFRFKLPDNQENGFPVVYLFDPQTAKVETIGGMDAIRLIKKLNSVSDLE